MSSHISPHLSSGAAAVTPWSRQLRVNNCMDFLGTNHCGTRYHFTPSLGVGQLSLATGRQKYSHDYHYSRSMTSLQCAALHSLHSVSVCPFILMTILITAELPPGRPLVPSPKSKNPVIPSSCRLATRDAIPVAGDSCRMSCVLALAPQPSCGRHTGSEDYDGNKALPEE